MCVCTIACMTAYLRNVLIALDQPIARSNEVTCVTCQKDFIPKSYREKTCCDDCKFLMHQMKSDGCYSWKGPKVGMGYGVLTLRNSNKKSTSAHRYAYIKAHGSIPDGLCVMHVCDNPECTNPKHLKLGTWADNNSDRASKGRSTPKPYTKEDLERYSEMSKGSKNNAAKLNEAQAAAIKRNYPSLSAKQVAVLYGVSKSCVKLIRANKTWSHV